MTGWIETVTGSLDQKKRYRRFRARLDALPEPYRTAAIALQRYVTHSGGVTDGATIVTMADDLVELW